MNSEQNIAVATLFCFFEKKSMMVLLSMWMIPVADFLGSHVMTQVPIDVCNCIHCFALRIRTSISHLETNYILENYEHSAPTDSVQ